MLYHQEKVMKSLFLVLAALVALGCEKEEQGPYRQNGMSGGAICAPLPQPQAPPTGLSPLVPKAEEESAQLKATPPSQWKKWKKVSDARLPEENYPGGSDSRCWCNSEHSVRCFSIEGTFEKSCKVCNDHATCDGVAYAPTDDPLPEE